MALTDYMGQQAQQSGQQAGQQSQQQQNVYNPQQQGIQGDLGGFYNQMLQGNIPQSFTNPSAPMQAFSANFDNNVAPGLAATYGAGSSAANSQKALAMQQLQGSLYNTGVGNYMNALGGAQNYAFNPIGGTSQGANQGQQLGASQTMNTINPIMMLLQSLLSGGL